ncbi:MAG: hypothetical protein FJY65_12670 [Calditrichaeota bacterium]|nr:hypothetical protein [Calditrichota bacterium]
MEEQRLSAIMFTDIVGYTAKMGADEVKMLRLLNEHDALQKMQTACDSIILMPTGWKRWVFKVKQ